MAEGTQLGKYRLKRKLATGGMAEIWLAEQRGPGGFSKELVVKRILPHLASDEKFVEMFLDEARLAAQLTHPNIVQIYDLGEVEGSYFIAMEYIKGHDLADLREAALGGGGPFDPLAAARIVADACAGLDYAHTFADSRGRPMNLVHRDVSPQNILVSEQGAVKLVDFGVAKAATSTHKTQTGAVKGKFAYMSPEQIKGVPLDGRSDLFAMGIVLFELLTGQRPFGHESELMAVTAILHHPTPDVRELNPNIPQPLRDIVAKALEKEPTQRFQTAEAMQMALEAVLASSGQPVGRKTLATYIGSLFSGAPHGIATALSLAATQVGSVMQTEQGVPASLRHGPQDQPTAKRGSDPGLNDRSTRQMDADRAVAERDTQKMRGRRGVSAGLWVAIVLVFFALAAAGYYLYDTLSKQSGGDGPVATDTGEGEQDASGVIVAGGDDAGPSVDDAGAIAASSDLGEPAHSPDAGLATPEDVGAATAPDVVVVTLVDGGVGPTTQPTGDAEVAATDQGPVALLDAVDSTADAGVAVSPDLGGIALSDAGVVAVADAPPLEDAGVIAMADVAATPDAAVAEPIDAGVVAVADTAIAVETDAGTVAVVSEDAGQDDVGETDEADAETVATPEDDDDDDDDDDDEGRSRRPGRVRVVISPPGRYEVLIDGEVVGRTPLPAQELSPGRHRVEVRRVGESRGLRERVNVRPGRSQTVRFDFRGR